MPDASPIRWHLAHTNWFFETFVLKSLPGYAPASGQFDYLFNSYYDSVGKQFPRDRRGLISRPSLSEITAYRKQIDRSLQDLLSRDPPLDRSMMNVIELGLHHEQQHQELMLTDIKHVFSCNPLFPAHVPGDLPTVPLPDQAWSQFDEGVFEVGHDGTGFGFDNELPRHRVFTEPFELSNRLVTNREYLAFIEDGGYDQPKHWLSLGWSQVQQRRWNAPLYWFNRDGSWHEFTLGGLKPINLSMPVTHVSYFEADAYARWARRQWKGVRLATESEWEIATSDHSLDVPSERDCLQEFRPVHPTHRGKTGELHAMFGSVWQWTSSSYSPYPGYDPPDGALGEYNGKFMCNQYVLRGSSCATPQAHARRTYRNFFAPDARWQFSGIRLARTAS